LIEISLLLILLVPPWKQHFEEPKLHVIFSQEILHRAAFVRWLHVFQGYIALHYLFLGNFKLFGRVCLLRHNGNFAGVGVGVGRVFPCLPFFGRLWVVKPVTDVLLGCLSLDAPGFLNLIRSCRQKSLVFLVLDAINRLLNFNFLFVIP
jgi:hypothetical protein